MIAYRIGTGVVCGLVLLAGYVENNVAAEPLPKLSFTEEEDGVSILIDGQLFTRYLTRSGTRPTLWPIVGPTEKPMTRSYPCGKAGKIEEKDHIHHRSMWIGYEGLGGHDFWHEPASGHNTYPLGTVKHLKFSQREVHDNIVMLVAENEWLGQDGRPLCTDMRTFQFGSDGDKRWIDCLLEIKATHGPLTFGDSKEGFFAVRVASTMRVDRKQGGRIVASTGKIDGAAWGQPAAWVDYHGPVDGQTVGLAMMCHPQSYKPKPRWHVRNYGLFAANPFGELAFTEPESKTLSRPPQLTLPDNEILALRYRVVLHRGDEKQADVSAEFGRFAETELRTQSLDKASN